MSCRLGIIRVPSRWLGERRWSGSEASMALVTAGAVGVGVE